MAVMGKSELWKEASMPDRRKISDPESPFDCLEPMHTNQLTADWGQYWIGEDNRVVMVVSAIKVLGLTAWALVLPMKKNKDGKLKPVPEKFRSLDVKDLGVMKGPVPAEDMKTIAKFLKKMVSNPRLN
ncbi:MAG: hypothetical protein JEZ11_23860 [Desulfobacterales bacterium]|nr:hypothetical protein [Desulfobacterales bacterium]